jgi:effector-binding domain-containing protein
MQLGDTTKMFFKVPDGYSIEELPQPNDTNIVFEKQEEKIMAAIRFNGWADDDKIKHYTAILKNALDKENIQHTNAFSFLGYNPPYELVNRRNEIAVELIQYSNNK